MAIPWLRLIDAALGMGELARRVRRRPEEDEQIAAAGGAGGPLEVRLAGVVVAALKEAFDRDNRRLELEHQQLEAERERAERALRLELRRQAIDREIGRMRLVAGVAAASWLGTLFFSTQLLAGGTPARVALGIGWLLLLSALAAAFVAQSHVARELGAPDRGNQAPPSSGAAGALAPWLISLGLAAVAAAVLLAA
jgi:hypothetical protein